MVTRSKAALQRSLEPLGVTVEDVESDLRRYVQAMKNEGYPPEAVVIAVKDLLSKRSLPRGIVAHTAFKHARNNATLGDAIVSLAIALYFGSDPDRPSTSELDE